MKLLEESTSREPIKEYVQETTDSSEPINERLKSKKVVNSQNVREVTEEPEFAYGVKIQLKKIKKQSESPSTCSREVTEESEFADGVKMRLKKVKKASESSSESNREATEEPEFSDGVKIQLKKVKKPSENPSEGPQAKEEGVISKLKKIKAPKLKPKDEEDSFPIEATKPKKVKKFKKVIAEVDAKPLESFTETDGIQNTENKSNISSEQVQLSATEEIDNKILKEPLQTIERKQSHEINEDLKTQIEVKLPEIPQTNIQVIKNKLLYYNYNFKLTILFIINYLLMK